MAKNIQMKNDAGGEWENLYPITKAKNVKLSDGSTLEDSINKNSVDTGAIDINPDDYDEAFYVKYPGGYATFYYSGVKLTDLAASNFLRKYIYFPFELVGDYTVLMNKSTDGNDVSVSTIGELHSRLRRSDRVQISAFNSSGYSSGDYAVVDVQIAGRYAAQEE